MRVLNESGLKLTIYVHIVKVLCHRAATICNVHVQYVQDAELL